MNKEKIEKLWKQILEEIGEDSNREGLHDTPKRIAKMYEEIFRGYMEPVPKITTFNNGSDGLTYDEMIMDEGDYYSQCEHHTVPFFGKYWFAYIPHPKGKILGISKVARVVNHFAAKLQVQERLTNEIVEHIWKELCNGTEHEPLGMAMVMKGEHLCKTMRGVKKKGKMTTTVLFGEFKSEAMTRQEFLNWVNSNV